MPCAEGLIRPCAGTACADASAGGVLLVMAFGLGSMLARLEQSLQSLQSLQSFTAHQRFAANAAHELLTPLATTGAALQVASYDPTGEELAVLAPMLRENNERNIGVVQALLDLAAAKHALIDPTRWTSPKRALSTSPCSRTGRQQ